MQNFLITGASGNLGGKLTKKIADSSDYGVIAVGSSVDKLSAMVEREKISNKDRVLMLTSEEMFESHLDKMDISGVVHFAFSRAIFPSKDIAASLDYSLRAFKKTTEFKLKNCIFISSQSIYGKTSEIRKESMSPAPESIYAMAKYGAEKLFEACYNEHESLQHAIVRLDNVIQSQNLVRSLCKTAKSGQDLMLVGGKQVFSYIDETDAADAVYELLVSKSPWRKIYNVGPNEMRVTLLEVAEVVRNIASKHGLNISVHLKPDDTELWAGMNTEAFCKDTGWSPKMSLEDMVNKVFDMV